MKSRFTLWAYFLGFYALLFTFVALACISADIFYNTTLPVLFYVFGTLLILFTWTWLSLGEMRNKVIVVNIGYDNLTVKRYLGMGKLTTFYFNQLDGFKTSILPSRGAEYEYLYLMTGNRKIIKLSQFYHKNYLDLKDALISAGIKDLGYEKYSANTELKEIFMK
jgi:hypothetical protein